MGTERNFWNFDVIPHNRNLLYEHKLSRVESFARKKNDEMFGINFCKLVEYYSDRNFSMVEINIIKTMTCVQTFTVFTQSLQTPYFYKWKKLRYFASTNFENYKFFNFLIHKLSRKRQNLQKPQSFLFGKVSPPKVDAPCDENLVKNTIKKSARNLFSISLTEEMQPVCFHNVSNK